MGWRSQQVRELELRSTIIFVDRDAINSGREMSRSDFIQEIKSIKPHVSYEEIMGSHRRPGEVALIRD